MGDLLTEMMSIQAASRASEAANQATKAREASEERLESSGNNPFIGFESKEYEYPEAGFFSKGRAKLALSGKKVSIKKTDISHLSEGVDGFGTEFTVVHLEERCNLSTSSIFVSGTMENVQNYINNQ